MPPIYRKKRHAAAVNKNDLKTFRHEQEKNQRISSGTLRERFPQVDGMKLRIRMESSMGVVLQESERQISLDEPLILNVPCQGDCSGGAFLLTDAIVLAINAGQESREGMGICEMSSYRDPTLPCGAKFHYYVDIRFK